MDYVRLGNTGLQVSPICFGTMSFGNVNEGARPWALDIDEARPLFQAAWEGGINFFDTANVYAAGTSEEITGELMKETAPREQFVLATKVFGRMRPGPNGQGLSRAAIMHEVDQSLKRLNTDYIDLYQIHRFDANTPVEETMEALHDVVKAGKVRYLGASSMFVHQFLSLQHAADMNGWTRFVSMQNQVNLIYREEEREMLPLCLADGVGVIPWSPLGRGKVSRPWGTKTKRLTTDSTGKDMYDRTEANDKEVVAAVQKVAENRGVGMAEIALAWVMRKDAVTAPIAGATKLTHIESAFKALDVELSADEVALMEAPYQARHIPSF